MTIGSILLGVALLVVVGLFLARPFLVPAATVVEERPLSRREALALQKEAVLAKIRELDFDRETGNVPPAEYQMLREQYLAEAAQILKALDAFAPETGQRGGEDDMEAAIARLRQRAASPAPAGDGEDIEAAVARLRGQQVQAAVNGGPTVATAPARRARFCSQCGEARDEGEFTTGGAEHRR